MIYSPKLRAALLDGAAGPDGFSRTTDGIAMHFDKLTLIWRENDVRVVFWFKGERMAYQDLRQPVGPGDVITLDNLLGTVDVTIGSS